MFCTSHSVRVSNELGSGHPKSAAFSVVIVTLVAFIISVICAILSLALRDVISYAFTEGPVVAAAVSDLCPLLALTLLLNGIQPVLSGIDIIQFFNPPPTFSFFYLFILWFGFIFVKEWPWDAAGKLLWHM